MSKLAEKRVAKGVALLDKKVPNGWRECINPHTLDVSDYDLCVLGQIYGNYSLGTSALGLFSYDQRVRLGFTASYRCQHADLTAAWLKELTPQ